MIFLGDIAHPFSSAPLWPDPVWSTQNVIANLEGALVPNSQPIELSRCLYNRVAVLEAMERYNVTAVSLANNHITDLPAQYEYTEEQLLNSSVRSFGAGINLCESRKAFVFSESGCDYAIIGAGWEVIQCRSATKSEPGVNGFEPKALIKRIEEFRKHDAKTKLIIMPHWNYEMELFPQPAHRQFSMMAIDKGADAIIGHHSHRVSGVEVYKGKPIVYSLGNWWLPQGVFYNGKVAYGKESYPQLAFEWNGDQMFICHWFNYDPADHRISFQFSEDLFSSKRMESLTPFSGMSHLEYVKWFRSNRVKNMLLPVYVDYRHTFRNKVKDMFVRIRHPAMLFAKKIINTVTDS